MGISCVLQFAISLLLQVALLNVVCRRRARWLSWLQRCCSFGAAPAVSDQQATRAG